MDTNRQQVIGLESEIDRDRVGPPPKLWVYEPSPPPGMFRTYAEFLRFTLKCLFGLTFGLSVLASFVIACARQPVEAVLAGVGLLCLAGAWWWFNGNESRWWRIWGRVVAVWLVVMAGLAWGVW